MGLGDVEQWVVGPASLRQALQRNICSERDKFEKCREQGPPGNLPLGRHLWLQKVTGWVGSLRARGTPVQTLIKKGRGEVQSGFAHCDCSCENVDACGRR